MVFKVNFAIDFEKVIFFGFTLGQIVFFGFMIFALGSLLIINRVATKYINGDYIVLDEEDEEYEGVVLTQKGEKGGNAVDREAAELYDPAVEDITLKANNTTERNLEIYSNTTAVNRIKVEGFEHTFASRAHIRFSIEHNKLSNVIVGSVHSIDGLSTEGICPDNIRFHLSLLPTKYKYKTKTRWKPSNFSENLALNFMIGPLKDDVGPSTNIRIRLYGRKKPFWAKMICFGECFVLVSSVLETDETVDCTKHLLPKATSTINSINTLGDLGAKNTPVCSESIPQPGSQSVNNTESMGDINICEIGSAVDIDEGQGGLKVI